MLKDLDAESLQLSVACTVLLDPNCEDKNVRDAVFELIPRGTLFQAAAKVEEVARPPEDNYYPELLELWGQVRRFLLTLLRTIEFQSTIAGQPILPAVEFLKSIESQTLPKMNLARINGVSKGWRQLIVQPNREFDRRAYTFCTLERLCEGLRRRDLFVTSRPTVPNTSTKSSYICVSF